MIEEIIETCYEILYPISDDGYEIKIEQPKFKLYITTKSTIKN